MYLAKDVEDMLRSATGNISHSRFRYQGGNGSGLSFRSNSRSVSMGRPESRGSNTSSISEKGPFQRVDSSHSTASNRTPGSGASSIDYGQLLNWN